MSEQILLLLDGNSLINRAFFGLYGRHDLTAPDGTPTGALFTFINMYLRLIDDLHPTHVVAAFDRKEPTFRHQAFDQYKGTRKPMPDELAVQIPLLKDSLKALGVSCLELAGYEADDLLGTLAAIGSSQMPVYVITGDKDSFQLASDRVTILQPVTRSGKTETERYDPAAIMARYQIGPQQIIDLKALMGDSSDNIPGVRGIGEKGAIELLSRFGSLDGVYAALDQIRPSLADKLTAGREMAYLSRELATICLQVPIDPDLALYRLQEPDADALATLFNRLGFKSLLTRLDLKPAGGSETDSSWPAACRAASLDDLRRDLAAGQPDWPVFWIDRGQAVYWQTQSGIFSRLAASELDAAWLLLQDSGRRPVLYDYKRLLRDSGLPELTSGVHDVLISAYLLNQLENRPDLERLYQQATGEMLPAAGHADAATAAASGREPGIQQDLFSLESQPAAESVLTGLPPPSAGEPAASNGEPAAASNGEPAAASNGEPKASAVDQAAQDRAAAVRVHALQEIAAKQRGQLAERGLNYLADEVEFPLAAVLAAMERFGFALDIPVLQALSAEMLARQDQLQEEIFRLCGRSFNLNSPKQLSEVLYRDLGLATGKKRTGGAFSTDSDELERLTGVHPVIDLIVEHRQTVKLRTTFVEGLMREADPADGRVHTTFNQTLTMTGRLSSSEPNLQNIPIRMAAGQKIRRAFIAGPGQVLIDADYSQIELRLLAHLSGDPAMIDAFVRAEDIHTNTACRIFDLPPERITPDMRSVAKTMNFSIVYGISDFGLARDLGVTVRQAHHYIEEYEQLYPRIRPYLNGLVEQAHTAGYVETLFRRRRYLPELKSANHNIRSFGERAAMNTPVQGTAADLIKIAMVRAARALTAADLKARLILQVHDELIIEAPADEVAQAAGILHREMEGAMDLAVPLLAEVRQGHSWADCK